MIGSLLGVGPDVDLVFLSYPVLRSFVLDRFINLCSLCRFGGLVGLGACIEEHLKRREFHMQILWNFSESDNTLCNHQHSGVEKARPAFTIRS